MTFRDEAPTEGSKEAPTVTAMVAPTVSQTPPRPANVPAAATWAESYEEWHLQQSDSAGRPHGPFRSWRADGSAREIRAYDHGKQVGPAWTFHPDGSLFSIGCFSAGAERGVHHRYANDDPRAERLQSCCVPPGAWQMRQDYSHPSGFGRGWFNRDGQRLLDSGAPYPELPPGVPAGAWFNESGQAWEMGVAFDQTGYTGTLKRWAADGTLRLIEGLVRGKRHGQVQSFDETGALEWDAHYIDGRLSGPFAAPHHVAGQFVDPRVCGQFGSFEADQAQGVWRYVDATGAVLAERDLGLVLDEGMLSQSPALVNERQPPSWWRGVAQTLFAARRVGEGLIAAARASARAHDPAEITQAIATWTLPLRSEIAVADARQAMDRGAANAVTLIDALKRGGDASTLLWAVGKTLPENDRAAMDLVSAAVLLAPASTERLATRALLYGTIGDLASARADVARVAAASPEQGEFLEMYLRVYFPRFAFWPHNESFEADTGAANVDIGVGVGETDAALGIARSPAEVRDVIQRYATRLGRLRASLVAQLAAQDDNRDTNDGRDPRDLSFMIPDLSALLPHGPAALSRWTFQMSAAEYQGVDPDVPGGPAVEAAEVDETPPWIDITVDETRGVEPTPTAILRILRCARADWSGLVWLCWAVGLDAPGLPDAIRPPASFARAAGMTMERVWRCGDKLRTSGLMALTKGIPGFIWEGAEIDLVPAALVDVALDEYLEARAVFSWLCDTANRSPWQDDLRQPDN